MRKTESSPQAETQCPTSEKSFTLFSSWKIQTTWVLPNPLLQPNLERVRQLCDFPSTELSRGSQWTAEAEATGHQRPRLPRSLSSRCDGQLPPIPTRAPGEFHRKGVTHTHTHTEEIKEDATDRPMPSLTLPVLTMALNEPLKLNYFIKVCLQS